jgi:energy-coupling factor transporter ATP-binding protein EcfA2
VPDAEPGVPSAPGARPGAPSAPGPELGAAAESEARSGAAASDGSPAAGDEAPAAAEDRPEAPPDHPQAAARPGAAASDESAAERAPDPAEPHVRMDARALESALLNLRKRIAAIPLLYEAPGLAEAKAERVKLLSQIDDYLLPRLRRSAAPILVALVGSTGAGKSTLVNSIVGMQVSATGVRRPTTNSPVLACHPDDVDWFAENNFLPSLPRVRQEGLARPGRDGLLVLAATEGMPKGVALLDTPDIDSVVKAHHEFAYQFLDASDLWLFVTSASRYADAPVWQVLQHARDRGASLGIVLSRVPSGARSELVGHFSAMLDANGIGDADRFVIPETRVAAGMLPPDAFSPIRAWLTDTARKDERRVAVLTQTMSGVLDTFKVRVPALAARAEAQLAVRSRLRTAAEAPYQDALAAVQKGTRDGSLLRGEVLARWQDFIVTGDLMRTLRSRKPARQGKRARKRQVPERAIAMKTALRAALESQIVAAADRAAEDADGRWRADPAGAALIADTERRRASGHDADRLFASAFGSPEDAGAPDAGVLGRSAPDLPLRAARAVSAWQDHVLRLVQEASRGKRSAARSASLDDDSLALLMVLVILGESGTGSHAAASPEDGDILILPRRIVTAVLGEQPTRGMVQTARAELNERARLLLDEELLRFSEIIAGAGTCDDVAGVRLYQAAYMLGALQ